MSYEIPKAEVEVDEALVRRLLAGLDHAEFRLLADGPVEAFASGWDNVLYRLGDRYLARLPRRAMAVPLLENEQRWLPELADRLPLPTPVPALCAKPSDDFGWPWSIVPWLDGLPLGTVHPTESQLTGLADDLAQLLSALHQPAPRQAPINPLRGIPLGERSDRTDPLLTPTGPLANNLGQNALAVLRRRWDEARSAPAWSGPAIWLHGDLHPFNLLVDNGRLAAVIDFGDIAAGDPATDLAIAWWTLPTTLRTRLRQQTRIVGAKPDDASWLRASGWALSVAAAVVANGAAHPALHRCGLWTLNAIADEDSRLT